MAAAVRPACLRYHCLTLTLTVILTLTLTLTRARTRARARARTRTRTPNPNPNPNPYLHPSPSPNPSPNPNPTQAERSKAAKQAKAAGGAGGGDSARREAINTALRSAGGRLVVADVAATRGLHFDAVSRVYVLGLPANADTYLHLAGRTGRWPRPERDEGEATVVTIATEAELRTLRGWSNMLGGVDFTPIE